MAAASFGAETPNHVAFQIQSLQWKANVLWNQPHFSYHNNLVILMLAQRVRYGSHSGPLKWDLTLFLSGILINSSAS